MRLTVTIFVSLLDSRGLLFSAHISYGKGKYLNQTGFLLQNLQARNSYSP